MRWTFLVIACAAPVLARAADRPLRVAFIQAFESEPWGARVVAAMEAAAEDLDIELSVHESGHWPTETLERVEKLCHGPRRPDYLVISVHRGIGTGLLHLAERVGIPIFLINAGLLDTDRTRFGGPRDYFKRWIGQMLPDDELAGHALADFLVEHAKKARQSRANEPVEMIALTGFPVDFASLEREKGLRRAVAHRPDAVLLQTVAGDWERRIAQRKADLLLRRYPALKIVWAANDNMAFGAVEALERAGIVPGVDVFVGGMNWDPDVLRQIRGGKVAGSMDGHFLEGAWALVLIYDYHHGRDFADERIDWRTRLMLISQENVERHQSSLSDPQRWREIDFGRYSKVKNQALRRYSFSVASVLEQLAKTPSHIELR